MTESDSSNFSNWLAAFFGTFLSTLILGVVAEAVLRVDYVLGVASGTVIGFLLGLGFMARKYGAPESVPNWLLSHAESGWQFGIKVFFASLLIGVAGVAWLLWVVLIHQRFGSQTVTYWGESLLLILLPFVTISVFFFLFYRLWKSV
ncbi:hypothetical protein [Haloarcula salinisoli]|uniref:Uncharacterized protein n=1 Tax=Haloarcula salinisoli TaxID=2487746 RepID=A0A8J7YFU3_9EURY|nr:hypothetical protein [Halomicroarcula salinisoli]MBX0305235.1 hypothetical protein [Halomicroarcula salinisoli]